MNDSESAGLPCSAPDLPDGYKQRMDKAVLTIMPVARRVMEICREFCSDSVEITDGDITVRLAQNDVLSVAGERKETNANT